MPWIQGAGVEHWQALSFQNVIHSQPSSAASSSKAPQVCTTPQGLSFWLLEEPSLEIVSFSLLFRSAGRQSDPPEKIGLAQLTAALLTEGGGEYPSAEALDRYCTQNKIQLSVQEDQDALVISVRTLRSSVAKALKVIQQLILTPCLEASAFTRIRHQILLSAQQELHTDQGKALDLLRHRLFPHHAYGQNEEKMIACLGRITPQDIRSFVQSYLTRDQLVITVSGGISADEMGKHLEKALLSLPLTGSRSTLPTKIVPHLTGKIFLEKMSVPQSTILFVQGGLSRTHPDFYPFCVLIQILCEGAFDSRLWKQVREFRGLTYGISGSLLWYDHTAFLYGATSTQNENVTQVIELIRQIWTQTAESGVTVQEVTFAKEKMKGSYPLSLSTTRALVSVLQNHQKEGLPPTLLAERNKKIEAVTPEDVNRVAKLHLTPALLSFIVVGDPPGLSEGENECPVSLGPSAP